MSSWGAESSWLSARHRSKKLLHPDSSSLFVSQIAGEESLSLFSGLEWSGGDWLLLDLGRRSSEGVETFSGSSEDHFGSSSSLPQKKSSAGFL